MVFSLLLLLCSPRYKTMFVTSSSETTKMAVAASQAVVKTVFCIEENREEEAEKTPSTCSNNQGSQHFSHLVYLL